MKKLLLIILDGAGDHAGEQPTPLQMAYIPNLDSLARLGRNGTIYPVRKGYLPETHTGVLSLLGYDVDNTYIRRGPIEAYGYGLAIHDGELAFRINFATLGDDKHILDRRVSRDLSQEEADTLISAVSSQVVLNTLPCRFTAKSISTYRGVLTIQATRPLSDRISNTDPAYGFAKADQVYKSGPLTIKPCVPLDSSQGSSESATVVNEFIEKSHDVLQNHPLNVERASLGRPMANFFLTRDVGNKLPQLTSLRDKYDLTFSYIVELPIERGIGLLTGMNVFKMRLTGDSTADYQNLANDILKVIDDSDITVVHVKGPDEYGHDGDCKGKQRILEIVDRSLIGNLLKRLDLNQHVICVTSDHATPCLFRVHSDDRVPISIAGGEIEPDQVNTFEEIACATGNLPLTHGRDTMPFLVTLLR